tara:strand:+ start:233 stop:832 length:600 start_codon:yes stop_codon:yes gene_type:complete
VSSSVEIAKIDIKPVQNVLKSYKGKLKKGSSIGVVETARAIAKAASAATRPGAKVRSIVLRKKGQKKAPRGIMYVKRIVGPSKNDVSYIGIKADSKEAGRAHRRAQILRQGLAKASWFWILSSLGGRGSQPRHGSKVKKSRNAFAVTKRLKGFSDSAVKLHSKLDYASDAFRVKGSRTIDNIGSRAAGTLRRRMENIRA